MKHSTEPRFFSDSGPETGALPVARRVRLPLAPDRDAAMGRRARPVTLSMRGASRGETEALTSDYPSDEFADLVRPTTRADCLPGGVNELRPCPYVSCKAHLALDVQAHGSYASLKLNFPDVEVWEMAETCLWDVVDRGGTTLDEVAALLNVSEERVRQIEVHAVAAVAADPITRDFAPEGK